MIRYHLTEHTLTPDASQTLVITIRHTVKNAAFPVSKLNCEFVSVQRLDCLYTILQHHMHLHQRMGVNPNDVTIYSMKMRTMMLTAFLRIHIQHNA